MAHAARNFANDYFLGVRERVLAFLRPPSLEERLRLWGERLVRRVKRSSFSLRLSFSVHGLISTYTFNCTIKKTMLKETWKRHFICIIF